MHFSFSPKTANPFCKYVSSQFLKFSTCRPVLYQRHVIQILPLTQNGGKQYAAKLFLQNDYGPRTAVNADHLSPLSLLNFSVFVFASLKTFR